MNLQHVFGFIYKLFLFNNGKKQPLFFTFYSSLFELLSLDSTTLLNKVFISGIN